MARCPNANPVWAMGIGGNQRATLAMPHASHTSITLGPPRPTKEMLVPFVMELARPHKQRFEVAFNGKIAIEVYDGSRVEA